MSKQSSSPPAKFPIKGTGNESSYITNNPHIFFVGDLSFFCTEEHLFNLFSVYGNVVNVEVKRGKATGDSLMHGYVELDSSTGVERAVATLDGKMFMGRKLRISRTNPNPSTTELDRERLNWVQLHVSFVTRQLDKCINEEVLHNIFGVFGGVVDVTVKRHKVSKDPKSQSGYGFVFYSNLDSARQAVNVIKHTNFDGVTYDCQMSYKSDEKFNNPKMQASELKSEVSNPHVSVQQPYFNPAPPAPVAVAVYPQYTTATNPYPQQSSSSFSRNPPTAVAPNLSSPHNNPQNMYINQRPIPDQFPHGYDGRATYHSSSPQIPMQQITPPHFNIGMLGYPQPMVSSPHPSTVQLPTPPPFDYSAPYPFSPQQSFSPHQYSVYGTVSSVMPYENYSNMQARLLPPPNRMVNPHHTGVAFDSLPTEVSRQRIDSRNNRSRHRQGNLRRVEEYHQGSANLSRSNSRDYSQYQGDNSKTSSNEDTGK